MKGGEDVVSNNENTNWSSSSDSYNHHHQYERLNRSVSGEQRRGHVLFFVDVKFRRRRGERGGKLVGRFMFRTVE